MNYIEILIENVDSTQQEILIAQLDPLGFSGFEEGDDFLKGYIADDLYNPEEVNSIVDKLRLSNSITKIPQQNWNALWESNFEPVIVDDFCVVRADFHQSLGEAKHEVIITPKMSFGTGHHATTFMMIQQMQTLHFENAHVADFGTGTGILAILAEKLGATAIQAIDNDEWSIENARENMEKNNCRHIELLKLDEYSSTTPQDIILANINKNVILANLNGLVFGLKPNGFLLLSGFLPQDEKDILHAFSSKSMKHINTIQNGNWLSIMLQL